MAIARYHHYPEPEMRRAPNLSTHFGGLLYTGMHVFSEALEQNEPWARALQEWDGTFDPWTK